MCEATAQREAPLDPAAHRQQLVALADDAARAALQRAQAEPDDAYIQLEASRALNQAADRRMLAGMLDRIEAKGDLTVDQILVVDEQLPGALKREVLGLAKEGLERARRALELTPDDDRAAYLEALSLAMVAWAEGTGTALLRGRGPDLAKGTKAIVERAPELDGCGPLRLRGRFLDLAPWPYGDEEEALELLERAQRTSPVVVSEWFLGDLYHRMGRAEDAQSAWARGVEAEGDESSGLSAELQRSLCTARIESAGNRGTR